MRGLGGALTARTAADSGGATPRRAPESWRAQGRCQIVRAVAASRCVRILGRGAGQRVDRRVGIGQHARPSLRQVLADRGAPSRHVPPHGITPVHASVPPAGRPPAPPGQGAGWGGGRRRYGAGVLVGVFVGVLVGVLGRVGVVGGVGVLVGVGVGGLHVFSSTDSLSA